MEQYLGYTPSGKLYVSLFFFIEGQRANDQAMLPSRNIAGNTFIMEDFQSPRGYIVL